MVPAFVPQQVPPSQWGCNTQDLLLIHGLFRNTLQRLPDLVRQVPPGDSKRWDILRAHLQEILGILVSHHHHEDIVLWDLFRERAPEHSQMADRLAGQHQEIAGQIDSVQTALEKWGQQPDAQQDLVQGLTSLKTALFQHLDEEEAEVMPLASRVLTQKEWDWSWEAGMAEIRGNRRMFQLGYLLRCAPTEALRQAFWKELPLPARLMYKLAGKGKFEQEWHQLYGD